jgi:type IV secretion system protein VirB10
MSAPEPAESNIRGERTAPVIARERAMSSRVNSILAVGLMSALGLGMLVWYYANTFKRQAGSRQAVQSAARRQGEGDLPLPSLGPIVPPQPVGAEKAVNADTQLEVPPLVAAPQTALAVAPSTADALQVKPGAQSMRERQLSGAAFAAQSGTEIMPPERGSNVVSQGHENSNKEAGSLAALLQPGTSEAVRAQILPSLRLLLPKGAFIDCTLETAIDSTLPGMTTCITATDTFGVDGKVVLLERGTKLVGETRGQVQQGAARVFVIWDEARTPTGVIVPLASPGADELGRSGLPGEVNRHFWDRFGAAMLISVLDGAVQAAVQSSRNGSGTVIVDPTVSEGVATEALKGTVAMAPTIRKAQGDRIQVMVARDLDFRTVYALHADTGSH